MRGVIIQMGVWVYMINARPAEDNNATYYSWKKQIVFISIIVMSFLLLAEGAIRTWALYFRTSYEQYNRATGRLELVPNLRYRDDLGREFLINSRGFVGPDFDEVPSPGTLRIIAVGDSCTFTLGLWQIGYPSVAEALLNGSQSTKKFEYINAGVEGYNSDFALSRIKEEIIRYRPYLVSIYIGWNDLMKQSPESQVETGEPSVLAQLINESYLVKAYKKIIFVYLRPVLFQPKLVPDEVDRHAYDNYVPQRYERNIREMVKVLRNNGIRAVLLTLPTVLEPGLTAADLKARGVFFPYYAGTFSVERLLSLHAAYNRTIRRVAAEEGVSLVDLDKEFDGLDKRHLFWDTMHPSDKGNAVIASHLAQEIASMESN